MALPQNIASGVAMPDQNYFSGPFKAPNGAIYVFVPDSAATRCFKNANPGVDSWVEQDNAGVPSSMVSVLTHWATLDGVLVHLVIPNAPFPDTLAHITFDTSDDTWGTRGVIESPKDVPDPADWSSSIGIRSDGDRIVLYNGDIDKDMGNPYGRVDYAVWEGSSWNAANEVSANSPIDTDYIGSVVVRGESDMMHFFWMDVTNDKLYHRSLAHSGNTLGTEHLVKTYGGDPGTSILHVFAPSVYYDDAGVERITAIFHHELGTFPTEEMHSSIIDDDGTPDTSDSIDTEEKIVNASMVCCAAVDLKTVHLLWSLDADSDLYYASNVDDAGWSAPSKELTATINCISCNIYPRNGALVLAYLYDDGGTVKYNEKTLTAPTAPAFASARFPDQNYHIGPFKGP